VLFERRVAQHHGHTCASCLALDGCALPAGQWAAIGIVPGCSALLCADHCRCQLETVDQAEHVLDPILILPMLDTLRHTHKPAEERPLTQEYQTMPDEPRTTHQEQRIQLAAEASVSAAGQFEIMAITAGQGNGYTFTAAVLQASLALWDAVECFVDHGPLTEGRKLKDLGGLAHSPTWDEAAQGIRLKLKTTGPSAPLVQALGRELLAETDHAPRVGFSADVLMTVDAASKTVQKILRVLSLDLVFNPARGGAFIRALNSVQPREAAPAQETHMPPEVTPALVQPRLDHAAAAAPNVSADLEAMRQLLAIQSETTRLAQEEEKSVAMRVQMCSYLLHSGLAASRLPTVAQNALRKRFEGQVFAPAELNQAITDQRELITALTAGAVVQGPGRISAQFNDRDRLQAAVDDLLQAPRDPASVGLEAPRLTGIRELYLMLTGDIDLHGGYNADRVQLATTADFTGLVKNAMNKIIVERWAQLGRAGYDWWKKICVVEHFNSLKSITGTLIGTVGSLPTVAEGGEYTELAVGDSPETASFTKYGGYIPLTLELIDTDDARKLAAYPRELANAALRNISSLVAAVFTANAGIGPTMADTGALFNATAVTTAGGHLNLLTTALAAAQWEVVCAAVYNQPMLIKNAVSYYGTGKKMGINPKYLLVPRALQLTAKQVLYPTLERAATIYTENLQRGEPGDVITVPEWTDTNDWAAVCDPMVAPAIYVGERFGITPEIFVAGDELSPAVFMNDEHRLKVRQFLAVWVNDFRPLHKENV
jgi:hypothetical protein